MCNDPGVEKRAARVLVTGATGFIGSRLAKHLEAEGHEVLAMTRHPETYQGAGRPVGADVGDRASLTDPLDGVDVAYYLVHSLDRPDFEEVDAQAARNFAGAAAAGGVRQIVYLGGLGSEQEHLSAHLRSRREVERILQDGEVPVTVLRAAVIVGSGGISWEITRQLVKNLPAMITPRWARTRTQPIAVDDVIRYLAGVLGRDEALGQVFEIGGPDTLDYVQMLEVASEVGLGKRRPIVSVPVLTPRLSSYWLALVTDVDVTTGRNLIDSMDVEVVVTDHSIRDLVPGEPIEYAEAVRRALEDGGHRG